MCVGFLYTVVRDLLSSRPGGVDATIAKDSSICCDLGSDSTRDAMVFTSL